MRREPVADALQAVFAEPQGLLAGAREVGDPIATLPVLFHLLWRRVLAADLGGELLAGATRVHLAPAAAKEVGGDAIASAAAVAG